MFEMIKFGMGIVVVLMKMLLLFFVDDRSVVVKVG